MNSILTDALTQMGEAMARQDNRSTNQPLWLVNNGREGRIVFLTQRAAQDYIDAEGGTIYVASAHQSSEMIALQAACIWAAGNASDVNIKNAYMYSVKLLGGGRK